jgi:phosphomannomutase/phosphoglucomutase
LQHEKNRVTEATPPSSLFGTSGIRGRADELFTPRFAEKLGRTFATYIGEGGVIFVGRDVRPHSKTIQTHLSDGLLKGGVNVNDCGLVPTPALLFAMKEHRASAGVIVTGSHTPAEIAGVLFFLSDTGEMDPAGELTFENIYRSEPWLRSPLPRAGSLQSKEIIETYLTELTKQVGRIGGYRVIVDPGNGATCATLPKALETFGCTVATINGEPDGRFPSRSPNPQPSTLTQLSRAVRESKADFGVGTDSDGDRALFATADGRVLWGDLTGALFAKTELQRHGGGTIVTTVNTSNIIKLVCQEHDGKVVVTKVGPPAIAEVLRSSKDAIFATEESGKHIWPRIIAYGDAALSSGKLLQIMSEQGLSLDDLMGTLPEFFQLKSTLECPEDLKAHAMRSVVESWKGDGRAMVSTLDGLKVEYPDLTWFLVRASGTEPLLRCSAEGRSINGTRVLLARATELALEAMRRAKEVGRA